MKTVRATFLCEATVGHVAFLERLRAAAGDRDDLAATWFALGPEPEGLLERVPPFSRIWTARASLRARRILDRPGVVPDALFFHTLAPALLSARWLGRVPTVISLDATPANVDQVGVGYAHELSPAPVEALKKRLVRRAFVGASALVAWSEWVKRSLVGDYGIDPAKILVQPPGVPLDSFRPSSGRPSSRRPGDAGGGVRILFVGGDFRRKGGEDLLRAFRRLPEDCLLDIVTSAVLPGAERVRVHRDIGPGDPRLGRLYGEADIFVLPTRADTWGHAVVEAMASGLPVVTTPVGALPEMVADGIEGLMVRPGDDEGLARALRGLADSPERRADLGAAARRRAVADFDAGVNLGRILDLVVQVARGDAGPGAVGAGSTTVTR